MADPSGRIRSGGTAVAGGAVDWRCHYKGAISSMRNRGVNALASRFGLGGAFGGEELRDFAQGGR